MKLKEILAISGQPGLFKFVAQSTNGIIVESLTDGKRANVPSTAKVSALSEISMFTETEDVPLADVLTNLYKKSAGAEAISHKSSPDLLKALFAEVLPDYDRDRVHVSDMKKLVQWYNILVNAGMKDFSLEDPEAEEDQQEKSEKKSKPAKKEKSE